MPSTGFKLTTPGNDWLQTHVLDRAETGICFSIGIARATESFFQTKINNLKKIRRAICQVVSHLPVIVEGSVGPCEICDG